jgi:hypothetical protein
MPSIESLERLYDLVKVKCTINDNLLRRQPQDLLQEKGLELEIDASARTTQTDPPE